MSGPAREPAGGERQVLLDVLRGFALFGIAVVNLPYLALTSDIADTPPTAGWTGEFVAWALVRVLGTMKIFPVFSMLFGIGLVLSMRSAERRGADFARLYPRRLAWLGVFGLLHGTLLFFGDILFVYSIAGGVLFLLRRQPPRRLLALAAAVAVFGGLLGAAVEGLASGLAEFDAEWDARERAVYGGSSWLATVPLRTETFAYWLAFSSLISFNWRVLAAFLVGAALAGTGALEARHAGRHRTLCWLLLPAGLVLESLATWIGLGADASGAAGAHAAAALTTEAGSWLLAAGYVTAWAALVHRGHRGHLHRLTARLAQAGRLSLTHYIGQSAIANALFLGAGLGWYAELGRAQLLALSCAVFVAQVAFGALWLRAFRIGPLEWVWRSLAAGARQPLRRREHGGSAASP